MIIRRKHTANFTTIGNSLLRDDRLEADEVGIMAYLLSQPHDWEVRRPALARRWRLGRDSIKRIVHSLLRTGWMVARKTRLENGTFFIVYEVRDEPGPELTPDEIKSALSLVSGDAGPDEAAEEDGQSVADHAPDEARPPTENPSWSAGQPSLAEPSTVNPSRPYKTLQNTDSQRTDSTKGVRAYADVKQAWPTANVLSETASHEAFLRLSDADKEACFAGVKPYLDDCRDQNRKVCDLTTFIRERRWERFGARQAKPSLVVVKLGSPQYFRWRQYKIDHGEWSERSESYAKQVGSIAVPSEWPPSDNQLAKTG